MTPRDTGTGAVLESIMAPTLAKNGYSFALQKVIGLSLGGRKHRVDVLVEVSENLQIPVSVKWQQVSGSAEEKVPFECIKLIHAIANSEGKYPYAYIVIGGSGWSKLKEFYLSGGLKPYIVGYELIRIIGLEDFITLANRRKL